jgi:hypothetical protein
MGRPDAPAPGTDEPDEPDGGDPACWAGLVCPECGGLSDGPPTARCRRCGSPLPED